MRRKSDGRGKREAVRVDVRLTDQTLSCAARAHVAAAERHAACPHVRRAMQAACRRSGFDLTRRLGRRTEAGPRQLLRRVRPPDRLHARTVESADVVLATSTWNDLSSAVSVDDTFLSVLKVGACDCPWRRCSNTITNSVVLSASSSKL